MTKLWISLFCTLLLAACGGRQPNEVATRSIYYWRTTFRLDSSERAFLRMHHVKKLYVRYFDVTPDDEMHPMPNATITFADTLPQGVEIVPVVFIVNRFQAGSIDDIADQVFRRILQMNETHDIKGIREIQIDCDWTMSTQKRYFSMLRRMRDLCHEHKLTQSATIRLHQLSLEVPPVDKGTLMMYNTGDFTQLSVHKPILDMKDVRPYLHSLSRYKLPLNVAYPLFTWRVLFRDGKYVGIMHGDDDFPVLQGDSVATRQPELDDIMAARRAVDSLRPDANSEVILYHLNNKNINRFTPNDYENIYQQH